MRQRPFETFGLYGAYQKCVLENRLAVLKAQNKHIQKELRAWQKTQGDHFRNQIDLLINQFQHNNQNPVQANPQELDSLNQQIDDLTQQIARLQVKCQTAEQAYEALKIHQEAIQDQEDVQVQPQVNQKVEDHQQPIDDYKKLYETISQELIKTRQEREAARQQRNAVWEHRRAAYQENNANFQKLTEARNERHKAEQERNAKIQELNQLDQSLNTANGNIITLRNNVTALETNVRRLQGATEYLPFKDRLGPRVPKYTIQKLNDATSELASIKGAVGVADHAPRATWGEYAKRYNELKTAAEVFKIGCRYALETLYEMAEEEQTKFRLNKSSTTYKSESAQVIYRFIALDFIKGGHPVANCQAYEQHVLQLNNQQIHMQSSAPEQVLEVQVVNGQRTLKVVTHFRYHDDFTPGEEALSSTTASYGIDPLGAKCIWEKLNDREEEHLFNLLMEPAIEDDHPALQKAYDYLQNLPPDRAQLITTLQSLIIDMGVSLEKKYQDLALDEWRATDEDGNYKYINMVDPNLQPFTKTKKEFVINQEEIIEWKLNEIALKLAQDNNYDGNPSFFRLMVAAKDHYQAYFKHIQKNVHQKIYPAYFRANPVTKKHLEEQYYVAHELTSHGCLFSNLLAVRR